VTTLTTEIAERIPKNPILSAATFSARTDVSLPSLLDVGKPLAVSRGCAAIGLALQHAGIGKGDEVLLPAYHCISMIEPVVWRHATPAFYRISPDTSVDVADLEAKLAPATRALVITHYFGFPQDMEPIRRLCDRHGIVLIEDCAHAFFGRVGTHAIGSFGDYAIGSVWKFFPVYDGGLLTSARRELSSLTLKSGGPFFQLKALLNVLELAFQFQRLRLLDRIMGFPLHLKDALWQRMKADARVEPRAATTLTRALGGWGFDAEVVTRKMSLVGRLVVRAASKARIASIRRKHYLALLEGLRGVTGGRPLFAELPATVVPQVFPFLIDDPEKVFSRLKSAGVPVIRFGEYLWEGMDPQTCQVSTDLSRRVFQFPCHQELRDAEMDWMIAEIRAALRAELPIY
jgi:dTDP-4-amino-4,6-dideoxygalactose transaminase